MAEERSIEELKAENRFLKTYRAGDGVARVLIAIIKWGFVGYVAYEVRRSVEALAGKDTLADIDIKASAAIGAQAQVASAVPGIYWWVLALAVVFGVAGVLYGLRQAQLRRHVIVKLAPAQIEEERKKDPRRSTSGLGFDGETRPEDT